MNRNVNPGVSMDLACIIVTYNPDKNILNASIEQLLKSRISIYIVDNWFSKDLREYLAWLADKHSDRISLICLEKNYGIAKALNIGIDNAIKNKHKYAILLDQDSIPQDGLLEEMLDTALTLSMVDTQAIAIGPRLFDPRSNQFYKFALLKWGMWKKVGCRVNGDKLIKCEFINSSGSLIFLKFWNVVGPFREDFFIDHVETEWYMRVRYLGFKCYGLCSESYLIHHMGDDVCRYWFLGWRYMPHRSPERHYTIVRNAIRISRSNHSPWYWAINAGFKVIFMLVYFSIFDADRKAQTEFILKGIFDGLHNEN